LFVAEKRAALEVVRRRLSELNLGHLTIDLHGADVSPRKVMQQIADALDRVRNAVPTDCEKIHKQLVDRRVRLNSHVARLHSRQEPTGLSIYAMQGRLLRLGDKEQTATRWRGEELRQLRPDLADRVRDLLEEAAGFESLFVRTNPSPWTGAKLPDGASVERSLDLVARTSNELFPAFVASLHALVQQSGLGWPVSISRARGLIRLVSAVQATLELYSGQIYTQDHALLLRDLTRGKSGGLSGAWAWLTSSAYRRTRRVVRALRTAGPASVAILFAELEEARRQMVEWKRYAENDSLPCRVTEFNAHRKNSDDLFAEVDALGEILPGKGLEYLSPD
jgi:hypothetical protein